MTPSADVIVVGAGPAGASAAWHLARAGAEVLLLDRAEFPRSKPCGEYLSPQASRILEAMGVSSRIEHAGGSRLAGMRVHAPNGCIIEGTFAAQHGFRAFRDRGIAMPRAVLDDILLDAAIDEGARHERAQITGLTRDAHGTVTGVETLGVDGTTHGIRARLVIGADGLRSVVARRAGLARHRITPRRLALATHYEGVCGMGEFGEMHVDRDGYIGLSNVGSGITNVAVVIPASRFARAGMTPAAYMDRWIATRPALARRFAGATRTEPVRATGPFAVAVRRAWADGVALVGDAAEFFDPFTGEGIYAALRGGELLAPFALEAIEATTRRARIDALRGYEAARRREFSGKWLVERLIGAAVGSPMLMNHAARALSNRREMADLLVGVTGDFVPPSAVLRPGYIARLLLFGGMRTGKRRAA